MSRIYEVLVGVGMATVLGIEIYSAIIRSKDQERKEAQRKEYQSEVYYVESNDVKCRGINDPELFSICSVANDSVKRIQNLNDFLTRHYLQDLEKSKQELQECQQKLQQKHLSGSGD